MPYLLKRVINSVLLLLITVSFVFFACRMIGDPALNMLGPGANDIALENLRRAAGLNDPLWLQWVRYMGGLLQGDFGVSYRYGFSVIPEADLKDIGVPVVDLVAERLPATFLLAGVAMAIAVPLGLGMGVIAAAYPRHLADPAGDRTVAGRRLHRAVLAWADADRALRGPARLAAHRGLRRSGARYPAGVDARRSGPSGASRR